MTAIDVPTMRDKPDVNDTVVHVIWLNAGLSCDGDSVSLTAAFQVDAGTQEEIDRLWSALGEGGEAGPCGWVKDRFRVSWQVVPMTLMNETLADPDPDRAQRAMAAMLQMGKLDIAALRHAADGA